MTRSDHALGIHLRRHRRWPERWRSPRHPRPRAIDSRFDICAALRNGTSLATIETTLEARGYSASKLSHWPGFRGMMGDGAMKP